MKAIRITETGGPEVIRVEDVARPQAGPGEIVIRQAAMGVNFIDTYHRTGLYPIPLPSVPRAAYCMWTVQLASALIATFVICLRSSARMIFWCLTIQK